MTCRVQANLSNNPRFAVCSICGRRVVVLCTSMEMVKGCPILALNPQDNGQPTVRVADGGEVFYVPIDMQKLGELLHPEQPRHPCLRVVK